MRWRETSGGVRGYNSVNPPHCALDDPSRCREARIHNLMRNRLMRNLWRATLTFAVVALFAAPATAQRQPRPGGGFGGFGNLLTNKSVQEELKITDDQKKKLEEVTKKVSD